MGHFNKYFGSDLDAITAMSMLVDWEGVIAPVSRSCNEHVVNGIKMAPAMQHAATSIHFFPRGAMCCSRQEPIKKYRKNGEYRSNDSIGMGFLLASQQRHFKARERSRSSILVRLLLTRHGETEWNASGLIQGNRDIPLNENGRAQARRLGMLLRGRHVVKIYASPLSRARETAGIIKDVLEEGSTGDIPLVIDPALAERSFGPLEGRGLKDLTPMELDFIKRLDTTIPGVEPLDDFRDRVFGFYRRLQQEEAAAFSDDDCVLVVSHVGQLRVLFTDLLRVTLPEKPRNCAAYELRATPTELAVVQLSAIAKGETEERKIILF
jgi:broad specificity phosphatase PhoE